MYNRNIECDRLELAAKELSTTEFEPRSTYSLTTGVISGTESDRSWWTCLYQAEAWDLTNPRFEVKCDDYRQWPYFSTNMVVE